MKLLRLGLIGLDTSHVEGFASILNDPAHLRHIAGVRIVAAFPGGSPDFPLSINRVAGYTQKLRDSWGVAILPSPRAVADAVDAILLTSVDGRVHRAQFEEIAPTGKPVFVDKPFATSSEDARRIAETATSHGTRFFSSSSLRFAGALQDALADSSHGSIMGAEFFGPLGFEPTQPGYFWYGIHTAEMLYATLGAGCTSVQVRREADHEIVMGSWPNGRTGAARGNLVRREFGGSISRAQGAQTVDVAGGRDPTFGLLQAMIAFFRGGPPPVSPEDTLELMRFLEAANESRETRGQPIAL